MTDRGPQTSQKPASRDTRTPGVARRLVDNPRRTILAGLAIILVAFVGLGTWAALAPLDSAAPAPGTIVVESDRKTVQHPDGGVIEAIKVREGQRVETGDLLIQLDSTQERATYQAARKQLNAALARRARLQAERAGAQTVEFPTRLTKLAERRPHAREAIADARRQFDQRRRSLQGRIDIQREKIKQLEQKIAGLEAERGGKRRQVEILKDELEGLRELYEKGYYPRTRILQGERRLARLEGEIGSATARIAGARNEISEARLKIEQLRRNYDERVTERLARVADRIAELDKRVTVAREKLRRTAIRAPDSGEIQDLSVHTSGGVIRAGQEIMQIIPLQDRLIVEAQVAPRDIDIVSEGQSAEVRLTALQGATTPTLIGTVTAISADRVVQRDQQGQGQRSFYRARVKIPRSELAKLDAQKLQAGMPTQVLIKTGEQTVLEYLLRPITDAMSRGFIEK